MEVMPTRFSSFLIAATFVLALAGCSSTALSPASSSKPTKLTVGQVQGNTPLPPGSTIKHDKSFIIGTGDNWFGQMTLNIGKDTDGVNRFFIQQYPHQGWSLVSSVRTARSLLIFIKGDRSLTVEITEGSYLTSGEAVLTASPLSKSNPTDTPGNGSINMAPLR